MRPAQIGELIGAAKLGKVVKKMINMVPRLQLDASIQPLTRGLLRVDLMLTPDFQWDQEAHGYVEPFLILVRTYPRSLLHVHRTFKRTFVSPVTVDSLCRLVLYMHT